MEYHGPKADFASITGSPLWGLSVNEVIVDRKARGWDLDFSERIETPYGLGPLVTHFALPSGQEVIWIPSYGGILGEELIDFEEREQRLFWILWKAGVKVLLVGGTSGTNDWRDPEDEDTIRPGDFVLPWSFVRDRPMAGSLPGTGIGGLLPNLPLLGDPFCISLSEWLCLKAEASNAFRKVHHPDDVRVILRSPSGGSFETDAETLDWRVRTKQMSSLELAPPVVILHGDCISPVLCRHLGIHEMYYHIPANWAQGHPAEALSAGLTETLDELYVETLPKVILDLEADILETVEVPHDCTCIENLKRRPDVYQEAMTQA